MSTDLMLRCVDHEPYIQSEDVGSSLSYLQQIRTDIANRAEIVQTMKKIIESPQGWPNFGTYQNETYWFLYRHPNCNLEIWDEYGRQYDLHEESGEQVVAMKTKLGKVVNVHSGPEGVTVLIQDLTPEGHRIFRGMM